MPAQARRAAERRGRAGRIRTNGKDPNHMKASSFISSYLSGEAFEVGEEVEVTIRAVKNEEVKEMNTGEKKTRLVVYFKEYEQGLIIRATNGKKLISMLGDETEQWVGKKLTMYCVETNLGNGLRLKAPKAA